MLREDASPRRNTASRINLYLCVLTLILFALLSSNSSRKSIMSGWIISRAKSAVYVPINVPNNTWFRECIPRAIRDQSIKIYAAARIKPPKVKVNHANFVFLEANERMLSGHTMEPNRNTVKVAEQRAWPLGLPKDDEQSCACIYSLTQKGRGSRKPFFINSAKRTYIGHISINVKLNAVSGIKQRQNRTK